MQLTRRQREVVTKLIALYRTLDGRPLHYSELADYIGVNRFSAYDMLKLLEEKGIVESFYRVSQGAGRSEVLFAPTAQALQAIQQVAAVVEAANWESLREQLLGTHLDDEGLSREIFGRLPVHPNPSIQYCAEVIAAILLRLHTTTGQQILRHHLPQLLPKGASPSPEPLALLGGFALGVLAAERVGDELWWEELVDHVFTYQSLVHQMKQAEWEALAEVLTAVIQAVLYPQAQPNEAPL